MEKYTQFNLNKCAINYLNEYLKNGDYYLLIKSVISNLNIEKGDIITYLPVDTDPKFLHEFIYGGVASLNKTQQWLASEVNDFLKENDNNCCFFPDYLLEPKYLSIRKLDTAYFIFSSQIYHYLNSDHIDNYDRIINTIRASDSCTLLIGILTSLGNNTEYFKGIRTLGDYEINILSKNTQKIIAGAWDGEGCIIWSKN